MGTSTIPDFSVASEEEKETALTTVWDHAIGILFKLSTFHPGGKDLKCGLSIKLWIPWNNSSNGMKDKLQ